MTSPTASQRKKQPKAPKVPMHSIFLGLYIDKQTNAMLAKIAKTEKTSRSFIVRKLLTEVLTQYDNNATEPARPSAITHNAACRGLAKP